MKTYTITTPEVTLLFVGIVRPADGGLVHLCAPDGRVVWTVPSSAIRETRADDTPQTIRRLRREALERN